MISLPEFKKILGPIAQNMSEKQIEQLRDQEDQLADVFFGIWLEDKNDELNNKRSLNSQNGML